MKVEFVPEVGDVVFLTSDLDQSMPMTIEELSECDCGVLNADVVWADFGDIKRDSFDLKCLVCLEMLD
jgi:hypothetical protein